MHRMGKTPNFGIDNAQEGLFLASCDYTPSCEEYEQLDEQGEVSGLLYRKQQVEFSLQGEVPYGAAPTYAMAAEIALANNVPDYCWMGGTKPAATTAIITAPAVKMAREAAMDLTISGKILPIALRAE